MQLQSEARFCRTNKFVLELFQTTVEYFFTIQ